jgi:hypothetical protein
MTTNSFTRQSACFIRQQRLFSLWTSSSSPSPTPSSAPTTQDEKPVFRLINGVLSRAERTLSYKTGIEANEADIAQELYPTESPLNDAIQDVFSTVREQIPSPTPAPDVLPRPTDIGLNYSKNPTITSTALAHSLWSYVLRPGLDTAIDATAGNGGDSVALARMLFSTQTNNSNDGRSLPSATVATGQLICIDIQQQACENTRQKLAAILPPDVFQDNIQVLQQSHAPLPIPRDESSVALVVYNLGFLPASQDKYCRTTAESTIASMADAILMLRVGGLLSVMTYPRTNAQEDLAVHAFLEGLALFSSTQYHWLTFLQQLDCSTELREQLLTTLQHLKDEGDSFQTWRVHEHKKIGWVDAPILLTATRIK